MNNQSDCAQPDLAPYVSFEEFRAGLPHGRFRVVVDPKLARRYVGQRLWLLPLVMAVIGAGLVLALTGSTWRGASLVFGGIAVNRLIAWNTGRILLYLATRDAAAYAYATENGVMEVRRAT